jgi:hypothetical protein
MAKVTISIDADDLRWLRKRAKRLHDGNLSAAVAEGTRLVRDREALGALLDGLGAPQLSEREIDAASAELMGQARPTRRSRRRAACAPSRALR